MSVKFEVKFKSLLESLVDYTLIDDIKAKTFNNKHRKKCVYYHFLGGITTYTEANFDLILSFDIECSQIIILFLVLAQYRSSSLKNRINLQRLTEGTSNTYLLHT